MFIPVLVGTARIGNYSTHAADLIIKKLRDAGHETEIVAPSFYVENPFTERIGNEKKDSKTGKKYKDVISRAEKIVVVTPEYNRSYPGELKLMIDMLYSEYGGKEFHLVGVSSGSTGGARAVEAFINVVVGVEGVPIKPKLYFSNCKDVFNESGELQDKQYLEKIERFVKNISS